MFGSERWCVPGFIPYQFESWQIMRRFWIYPLPVQFESWTIMMRFWIYLLPVQFESWKIMMRFWNSSLFSSSHEKSWCVSGFISYQFESWKIMRRFWIYPVTVRVMTHHDAFLDLSLTSSSHGKSWCVSGFIPYQFESLKIMMLFWIYVLPRSSIHEIYYATTILVVCLHWCVWRLYCSSAIHSLCLLTVASSWIVTGLSVPYLVSLKWLILQVNLFYLLKAYIIIAPSVAQDTSGLSACENGHIYVWDVTFIDLTQDLCFFFVLCIWLKHSIWFFIITCMTV